MLKNKDLQSCPNPADNYPGDEKFRENLEQTYPGLLDELDAFLVADVSGSSGALNSSESDKLDEARSDDSASIFQVSSTESAAANLDAMDTSTPGPSNVLVQPQKPEKPAEPQNKLQMKTCSESSKINTNVQSEAEKAVEDEEAALLASPKTASPQPFAFDIDDSWDAGDENSEKGQNIKNTHEAQDVLTVHAENDFEQETAVRPTRECTKSQKRFREPSSTESSSPAKPSPARKVTKKLRSVVKRLKPARSASAAPLSPPAPVYHQKPATLAQAKTNALHDKKFSKALQAADEDSNKATKREALPNFEGLPLATAEGKVNPVVAERLANKGREFLVAEAQKFGVMNDYFVQKLLKTNRRTRSLSQTMRPKADPNRWLPKASPYGFTERGRRRDPEQRKKDATRQFIDGKPKHLQPRE